MFIYQYDYVRAVECCLWFLAIVEEQLTKQVVTVFCEIERLIIINTFLRFETERKVLKKQNCDMF